MKKPLRPLFAFVCLFFSLEALAIPTAGSIPWPQEFYWGSGSAATQDPWESCRRAQSLTFGPFFDILDATITGVSNTGVSSAVCTFRDRRTGEITTGSIAGLCPPGFFPDTTQRVCSPNTSTVISLAKSVGPCPAGSCPVGNPINPLNGNKYQVETLYAGAGSYPLAVRLTYNSRVANTLRFAWGSNWRSTFDRRIVFSGAGSPALAMAYRPDGRTVTFYFENGAWAGDFDVVEKLEHLTDASGNPAGRQYAFGYDASDNLVSVSFPDAPLPRRYHYEDARFYSALTGITDENGVRFSTYAYDSDGMAVSSVQAGNVTTYTHGSRG